MSSGFVSGGTIEHPKERDEEWQRAQAELEEKRRLKEQEGQQDAGKSLYEVLQANKAAKQDAFEEATRLKNQYRALDDDEAEFLDSVLEATRKKEAEVKKDTLEQLDAFRKRQEEAERKALEEEGNEGPKEEEGHWVTHGRKRKKGPELLKGVKLRRTSSAVDDKAEGTKTDNVEKGTQVDKDAKKLGADATIYATRKKVTPGPATATRPISASPSSKPSNPLSLGLGYTSSDEDD